MRKSFKRELLVIAIAILPFLYLLYIWPDLPARVPLHWDSEGHINGWGTKFTLILIPFLLPILTYVLFVIMPLIDPRKNLMNMGSKFQQLKLIIVLLMTCLALAILSATKSHTFFSPNGITLILGLLFTIIGNYLPSLKPNYFIGFKTPWTLENDIVWKKTHQLAGKMWFPGGLIIITCIFLIPDPILTHNIFVAIAITISIVPIVYSFLIFKKESKKNNYEHHHDSI